MNSIDTLGVAVERRAISAGLTHVPAAPYHRLGMHIGTPVNANCRCDGRRYRRVQSQGDIDIVPAGLDGDWEDDAPCTILRIWVNPLLVRRIAEELEIDPDRIQLEPQFQRRDPHIEHIAYALMNGFETQARADRIYVEGLARSLAVRLFHAATLHSVQASKPGLPSAQKHRLIDFIEANLDRNLSLDDLADVALLSASHMQVLFRRSFGLSVHQYIIRRRVERAKELLLAGVMPPSQVALETGFSHQSHMARCMKQVLGVTPGALIRLRR